MLALNSRILVAILNHDELVEFLDWVLAILLIGLLGCLILRIMNSLKMSYNEKILVVSHGGVVGHLHFKLLVGLFKLKLGKICCFKGV